MNGSIVFAASFFFSIHNDHFVCLMYVWGCWLLKTLVWLSGWALEVFLSHRHGQCEFSPSVNEAVTNVWSYIELQLHWTELEQLCCCASVYLCLLALFLWKSISFSIATNMHLHWKMKSFWWSLHEALSFLGPNSGDRGDTFHMVLKLCWWYGFCAAPCCWGEDVSKTLIS